MLRAPTRQLALYWFFMTGALGVFFPYFSLYLSENVGLQGAEVGVVFAAIPLMGMLMQPIWGQLADRTGSRTRILSLLACGAAVGYAGLGVPENFAGMLFATLLLAFFSTALLPMAVSVSMATLGPRAQRDFGRVRVWGTVGFLIMVVSLPPLLHRVQQWAGWQRLPDGPSEPGLGACFGLATLLALAAAAVAYRFPSQGAVSERARPGDVHSLLRHPPYLRVLLFTFASYLFLHGPMVLFPIYLRSRGGDMTTLSQMWIFMLLFEIPLVWRAGDIVERLGPRRTAGLATAAGGLRWLVCAHSEWLPAIFAVQMIHAMVVSGILVATPVIVESLVPGRLRSTGQSLLTMLGASLGGVLSSTLCGLASDRMGINAVYWIGGLGAVLVGCAAPLLLPRTTRRHEPATLDRA